MSMGRPRLNCLMASPSTTERTIRPSTYQFSSVLLHSMPEQERAGGDEQLAAASPTPAAGTGRGEAGPTQGRRPSSRTVYMEVISRVERKRLVRRILQVLGLGGWEEMPGEIDVTGRTPAFLHLHEVELGPVANWCGQRGFIPPRPECRTDPRPPRSTFNASFKVAKRNARGFARLGNTAPVVAFQARLAHVLLIRHGELEVAVEHEDIFWCP